MSLARVVEQVFFFKNSLIANQSLVISPVQKEGGSSVLGISLSANDEKRPTCLDSLIDTAEKFFSLSFIVCLSVSEKSISAAEGEYAMQSLPRITG